MDIVTTTPDGYRHHLNLHGLSGVQMSTRWDRDGGPSGCWDLTWNLDVSPDSSPPWLAKGVTVHAYDGPSRVYAGLLDEPERGRPWRCSALGLGRQANYYSARESLVVDDVIDAAITRGLPWIRPTSISLVALPGMTDGEKVSYPFVADVLGAYARLNNQQWVVWDDAMIVLAADPTTPRWRYRGDAVMGVADDDYRTLIRGRYVDGVTGSPPVATHWAFVEAEDTAAAVRWGPREAEVDLTNLGFMAEADAQANVDARLVKASSRLGWTNGIRADEATLLHHTGTRGRLSQFRAGDMLQIDSMLNVSGNLNPGASVCVVIAETRLDVDAGTLDLLPVGLVDRDMQAIMANPPEPPTTVEVEAA